MKNLLIYIHPEHRLNPEHEKMLEVQIENSLEYWDKKDIVLCTNFPYEYKGVRAIVGSDTLINSQYQKNPRAIINSKINAIIYLLERRYIKEITWFHDFDSFQIDDLDIELIEDIGVVCYGIYPSEKLHPLNGKNNFKYRVNFGNVFFKPSSLQIFQKLLKRMDAEGLYEEDAMTLMIDEGQKAQIMDQGYNLGIRCLRDNLRIAKKPKIIHFPPDNEKWLRKFTPLLTPKLKELLYEKFNDLCKS